MSGGAESLTDAQFKIARLYGFASWPKLKAHVDSLEEIGQLKQAIEDRKSTRLNSRHTVISYAVFCLKKKSGHRDGCRRRRASGGPRSDARPVGQYGSRRTVR